MKSLAYSSTREYHREYTRKWRAAHPNYTRDWNRLNRNTRITNIDVPTQTRHKNKEVKKCYIKHKQGHCRNCTILLTSKYAGKGNDIYCEQCLHKLSPGNTQL